MRGETGARKETRIMARKRLVLEMGMGVDLHGKDYTKAAERAVREAIWHNSLSIGGDVGQTVDDMYVDVTVAVPNPAAVDRNAVLAALPHGHKSINVVQGGLEIPNEAGTDAYVIANAAVVVSLDI